MPSLLGAAKGVAKTVGKKAINKLKGMEKYRKYVWYDYSIVEKARIQIIGSKRTIGSCSPGKENELFLVDELPVQINPSEFSCSYHTSPFTIINRLNGDEKAAKQSVLHSFGEYDRSPYNIPLIFDIYDEYNARSMNGSMNKDFSLMDEKATSLPKLIKYVEEGRYYARFLWGDMEKFGLLSAVDMRYTAFSAWGQPLKAEGTLEIIEQPYEGKLKIEDDSHIAEEINNTGKKIVNGIKNIFR